MMNTQLYSGFDVFGRVIPTVAHAAQIREIYRRIGQKLQPGTEEWLASAERRGQAMDAAMEDDMPMLPNSGERNNDLMNAEYARICRGDDVEEPEYEHLNGDFEGRAQFSRDRGDEFRKKMVKTPEQIEADFREYKKTMGWDHASDAVLQTRFELNMAYRNRLNERQPLAPVRQARKGGK
jgi:hypothetical protein